MELPFCKGSLPDFAMKTRAELKKQAKEIISQNYWSVIGATFLACLIYEAVLWFGSFTALLVSPIMCGLTLFYISLAEGDQMSIGDMFSEGFTGTYYLRRVGGVALRMLYTFLWGLLLVIPGIVKSYSYALVPYILARYPQIEAPEAIRKSMQYMNGYKADLFMLHLSFIGWTLLSGLTFGVVGIFFVVPYISITETLWYKQLIEYVAPELG